MTTKRDVRQAFRLKIGEANAVHPSSPDDLGARLETLFKSERFSRGIWAGFQPTGFEPDIRQTQMILESIGIEWAFPRVDGQSLKFFVPNDPAVFTLNQWGILEPDPVSSREIELKELRGLLIPGLAFDSKCNRLGRGAGFYDRSLSEIQKQNTSAIKVGIALDLQISDRSLPVESFDVPMDWVVTETRTFRRSTPDPMGRKTL